jgi:hypothetical protein
MTPLQIPWRLIAAAAFATLSLAARTQEPPPGADVQTLLTIARERNPEYASMRAEAQAAGERVTPAGAFPDPRFRVELMDITKMGEQNPSLWPGNVGGTKYTLTQELPWFGKRDLKREIATFDAEGAQGKAQGTWSDLAARIKVAQAQRLYLHGNRKLTQEILDLMSRLEKIAQVRYANGLAAQQDVIRAQVEQTTMRSELVALDAEARQVNARLNALLARPAPAPLAEPTLPRPWPAPAQLDFATLEERVRSRNPLLFAEEARVRSAEKGRELAYRNRIPDFMVEDCSTTATRWGLPDTSPMGAEEGPDGHGLHRRLCGRDESENRLRPADQDQHREGPEARRAHRSRQLRTWTRWCAPPVASSPTNAASMPSRRSSRATSSACTSTSRPAVGKGQPLFEVYSPELVSAQREYAIAMQGVDSLKDAGGDGAAGMRAARRIEPARLRNWDISDEQVKALASSGEARRTLTFRSPASGIVTEKKAVQGMRFMPGEALYQVADLSSVWVIADVFEQDIGLVKTGAKAKVASTPTRTRCSRAGHLRLSDAQGRNAHRAGAGRTGQPRACCSSRRCSRRSNCPSAAKGTGAHRADVGRHRQRHRQIVLVQLGEGRFEPREVKLGRAQRGPHVEVIEGVKDGEQVVVAANFLIDAESNLKAAIGGFAAHPKGAAKAKAEMPGSTGAGRQRRRPPGRRHGRQRRREGRHGQPQSRPGAQPQMAGHDDGVQGRQHIAAARAQAGCEGFFRVRRAAARRMGDHRHHPARQGAPGATANPHAGH